MAGRIAPAGIAPEESQGVKAGTSYVGRVESNAPFVLPDGEKSSHRAKGADCKVMAWRSAARGGVKSALWEAREAWNRLVRPAGDIRSVILLAKSTYSIAVRQLNTAMDASGLANFDGGRRSW